METEIRSVFIAVKAMSLGTPFALRFEVPDVSTDDFDLSVGAHEWFMTSRAC
ncbi:hypothetical protein PISMIDRAFT_675012 [Pisolithus microcarpus 441]|uniref:Uncharacterized protein n=1 Tax=Pisolithus microcarpus 441 TaxID=765257 RepID=A0A0C9ZCZ9_9AGAM|nr:hypothetical protein PISMIDRAFT_675012 [Pisolithus microcarpus 441]